MRLLISLYESGTRTSRSVGRLLRHRPRSCLMHGGCGLAGRPVGLSSPPTSHHVLHLVGVLLRLLVLDAALLNLLGQAAHGESRVDTARVLRQRLVDEMVLALHWRTGDARCDAGTTYADRRQTERDRRKRRIKMKETETKRRAKIGTTQNGEKRQLNGARTASISTQSLLAVGKTKVLSRKSTAT